MPLDLHVLGLSLAFILSQDQTLRCNIYFFSFSYSRKSRYHPLLRCPYHFLILLTWTITPLRFPKGARLFLHFSLSIVILSMTSCISFRIYSVSIGKRMQKYTLFYSYPNLFWTFFRLFSNKDTTNLITNLLPSTTSTKKIFSTILKIIWVD